MANKIKRMFYLILGVFMVPTAQLADKQKSNELEMFKLRVKWQKEKTDELSQERDYLNDKLASDKSLNSTVCSEIVEQFRLM